MSFYKVASLLLAISLVTSCTKKVEEKTTKVRQEPYNGPSLESKDLHVVKTDSARITMTLDAKTQLILNNDDQEYPEGILVKFFDGKDVITSTILSNYAFYDNTKDKWELKGDVKVVNNEKGQKMDTDLMYWSPSLKDSNNIFVPDTVPVHIIEPDQALDGMGLRATDDFSYYRINHVTGIKYLE